MYPIRYRYLPGLNWYLLSRVTGEGEGGVGISREVSFKMSQNTAVDTAARISLVLFAYINSNYKSGKKNSELIEHFSYQMY